MKKMFVVLCIILYLKTNAQQSVGIGTTTPNASAALDISSTNKGILPPRMTTAQRNAIVSPVKGLLVFDSEYNSYWHYTGNNWKEIAGNAYNADGTFIYGSGSPSSVNMTANGQILTGNSGFVYDNGGPSGDYGNNQVTMASIVPDANQLAVNVVVISLALESPYDSLVIRDTYGNSYALTGNTTGSYRMYGTVDFIFRSNFVNTQAGFAIRWDRILADADHHYDSSQLAGWYFNPSKFYMRGGINLDNAWHPDSSGERSFAYGDSKAKGMYATAMGYQNNASGSYSTALGYQNNASGNYSTAWGFLNQSTGPASTTLGASNTTMGDCAFATGTNTISSAIASLSGGTFTVASGPYAVALGAFNNALGMASFAMGGGNTAAASSATALGAGTRAKAYGGTVIGNYNDTTDAVNNSISPNNRIFQVGNGTAHDTRSNAITVLQNGNIGMGILGPDRNLVVAGAIRVDGANLNNGTTTDNALFFGGTSTGEYIGVKRTAGGNQFGFDFYCNNQSRMSISSTGNVSVDGNVSVQNGKGIIRGTTNTQQKIQSAVVNINLTLSANSTTTIPYSWPEVFGANPLAFIGNVALGSTGGWAEIVSTLATPNMTGGILYLFNPRSTSASINFNLVIIGIGAQ